MAPSTALVVKSEDDPPYQLSSEQTLKASKALLTHIKSVSTQTTTSSDKKSLLPSTSDDEDSPDDTLSTPIYLILTTKTHITDTKRLKPSRVTIPHSLNTSPALRICLITASPQRLYKDLVFENPSFPSHLSAKISKVVSVDKIKKKWTQYEAQRKLMAEHDVFLADDRIIVSLPKLLGKTFYKSTSKRPIPVDIAERAPKSDGKKIARAKGDTSSRGAGPVTQVVNEIEKALSCALVHLSPSTNTSIRVGYASWDAEKLAENIEAVTKEVVAKFVPKKWRGVRGVHVKGPETASLPIWLAEELWVDEGMVVHGDDVKPKQEGKKSKRKLLEDGEKESKKQKVLKESNDDTLDKEIADRKAALKAQKEEAEKDVEGEGLVVKKEKKSKKMGALGVKA